MHRAPRAHGPKPCNVPHTRKECTVHAHSRQSGWVGGLWSTHHHPKKKENKKGNNT